MAAVAAVAVAVPVVTAVVANIHGHCRSCSGPCRSWCRPPWAEPCITGHPTLATVLACYGCLVLDQPGSDKPVLEALICQKGHIHVGRNCLGKIRLA